MSEKLLPCPFCGGEALIGQTLDNAWCAMCIHDHCCKLESYWRTAAEALTAWNTRTAIQADEAPVDDRVSTSSPVDDRGSGNTSDNLRDAVKVWQHAYEVCINQSELGQDPFAAAAVIEADREAVRAEQAAYLAKARKEAGQNHDLHMAAVNEVVDLKAELAKWRDRYNKLGQLALGHIRDLSTDLNRVEAELAKFKALAETLAGALEKIATSKYDGLEVHRVSARQCHRIAAEALHKWEETRDAS